MMKGGFQRLPSIANTKWPTLLQTRMHEIVAADRKNLSNAKSPTFSSVKQEESAHVRDRRFDESAENITVFYEEDGITVNKVGHALDQLDEVFKAYSHSEYVREICKDVLGLKKPVVVQSMYIFKAAGGGSEVIPHKDNSYLMTEPRLTTCALWLPIHRATVHNGCLRALRGSHQNEPTRFFKRIDGEMAYVGDELVETGDWVDLEVDAGEPVAFSGNLTHASNPNNSDLSREAFVLHFIEGTQQWAPTNWLQRPTLGFHSV